MKIKILSILFIFFLITFALSINVFANIDFTYNDEIITLPDLPFDTEEYPNYGIYYHKTNGYTVFYARHDMDKAFITSINESSGTNTRIAYYQLGTTTKGTWYYYVFKNGMWGSRQHTDTGFMHWSQHILYSSFDIYTDSTFTDIYYGPSLEEPDLIYPGISNTAEDLATGTFNNILVLPGTFSNTENIGFGIYKNSEDVSDIYSTNPVFSTMLVKESRYYKSVTSGDITEFWYEIPRSNLDINFKNGEIYTFVLLLDGSPIQEIQVTIGGLTEEDILNNNFDNLQSSVVNSNKELQETIKESNKELQGSIDKQTEAIEENNKTNKNIFEKIGEILSYLNPFSENFFAYKLVELIINGLKSLFVPSDDFFSNLLDDLNEYFGDTFGILYYPFELLVDFLNRVGNIADTNTAIISVPSFTLSFMGYSATFFENMSFDLNSILANNTFKTIHDIYLIFTDIILWLGVIYLAGKMLRSIFGGMGDEVQSRVEESQEGERSYERYKQYQENKKRYKQENKGR